ncbi:hypothetical protein Slin15195_G129540 [Septoria linicola]|uniref:Uncharacterized protein n=1 Tax=Septoria linicola TaxID=215465 RepID=A0A9Q9B7D5_9PEZI|nr:hypothetical protein Slin15195_G129540 [Septoria linicola]
MRPRFRFPSLPAIDPHQDGAKSTDGFRLWFRLLADSITHLVAGHDDRDDPLQLAACRQWHRELRPAPSHVAAAISAVLAPTILAVATLFWLMLLRRPLHVPAAVVDRTTHYDDGGGDDEYWNSTSLHSRRAVNGHILWLSQLAPQYSLAWLTELPQQSCALRPQIHWSVSDATSVIEDVERTASSAAASVESVWCGDCWAAGSTGTMAALNGHLERLRGFGDTHSSADSATWSSSWWHRDALTFKERRELIELLQKVGHGLSPLLDPVPALVTAFNATIAAHATLSRLLAHETARRRRGPAYSAHVFSCRDETHCDKVWHHFAEAICHLRAWLDFVEVNLLVTQQRLMATAVLGRQVDRLLRDCIARLKDPAAALSRAHVHKSLEAVAQILRPKRGALFSAAARVALLASKHWAHRHAGQSPTPNLPPPTFMDCLIAPSWPPPVTRPVTWPFRALLRECLGLLRQPQDVVLPCDQPTPRPLPNHAHIVREPDGNDWSCADAISRSSGNQMMGSLGNEFVALDDKSKPDWRLWKRRLNGERCVALDEVVQVEEGFGLARPRTGAEEHRMPDVVVQASAALRGLTYCVELPWEDRAGRDVQVEDPFSLTPSIWDFWRIQDVAESHGLGGQESMLLSPQERFLIDWRQARKQEQYVDPAWDAL